jgi:hypothetical protein
MPWKHSAALYRDRDAGLLPVGWESLELEAGGRKAWWHEAGGECLATPIALGDGGAEALALRLTEHGLDPAKAALASTLLFARQSNGATTTP